MEVVIMAYLLVEEQVMLVEWFGVDKQLATEDIANMFEDIANMADDTVDMVANMVGMVEDMVDIVESIVKMVSIIVEGNFGATMAWVHSTNSEHTFDLMREIVNSGLETYLEVEVLVTVVSLCP